MNQPLIGCIADDITGASDLANALALGGMSTVQVIGVPDILGCQADADAVVSQMVDWMKARLVNGPAMLKPSSSPEQVAAAQHRYGKEAFLHLAMYQERPDDKALGEAVREKAEKRKAVLFANHGPVICGKSVDASVYSTEEFEEAAKLYFLLHDHGPRFLSPQQEREINLRFPS